MIETKETAKKRGAPLWAQITIWLLLTILLVMVGLVLKKTQTPMIQVGERVSDFNMSFYKGYEYGGKSNMKLSDLRGKVVLINIWASWCKPCEQEAADLQAAWQYYKDQGQVAIIGVDYVDTPDGASQYMKKFGIQFANAPDLQSSISSILNRNMGVPETYFIGRDGVLKYVKIGPFASVDEIKSAVDAIQD